MQSVYQRTSPTRPAPKPARSARQVATGERLRQISEQADVLYTQLFEALSKRHTATAHHLIDRMLVLGAEHDSVLAAAQDDAGTSWGWTA